MNKINFKTVFSKSRKEQVPQVYDVKGSMNPQVGRKQSWLKGRAEAAGVKLLKSILHSASTNVLHSDWGQSDRPDPPSSIRHWLRRANHTPGATGRRGCLLCLGFKGGGSVRVCKHEECRPSFTDGDAISAGAVGGYQGDSSTSTLARWILRHCHLLAKTWMCHTKLGVLHRHWISVRSSTLWKGCCKFWAACFSPSSWWEYRI